METLEQSEIEVRLQDYPEWTLSDDNTHLLTEIEFEDFSAAIDFINVIAQIAEDISHHPDITLYDYRYVQLAISTHDSSGITEQDFEFVGRVDELFRTPVDDHFAKYKHHDKEEELGTDVEPDLM